MNIKDISLKIEKKWAWSFSGFLLAIIFGAITIYTSFFQDLNPNLQFIVETNTSVLDLKEDVKNLEILYNGIDIKKQNKNLSIIRLKIINNSNVNITKYLYDDLSPIKVLVKNAEIVDKPRVSETSNNYLKENLNITLDSSGCIHLPQLIIEGHEFFILDFLILHNNGINPKISSAGKIAGQINGIEVIKNYHATIQQTFWGKIIYGNLWIHIVRFLCYFIFLILTIIAIVLPTFLISDAISKKNKKKRISKYKIKKNIKNSPEADGVFDLYIYGSLDSLINIQSLLKNKRVLKNMILDIEKKYKVKTETQKDINISEIVPRAAIEADKSVLKEENLNIKGFYSSQAKQLIAINMVKIKSDELVINKKFSNELNDFISYLKLI